MFKRTILVAALAMTAALPFMPLVANAKDTRNPFGVADVYDPDGSDIKQLAARTQLPGGSNDRNAEQWVPQMSPGRADSLDGEWYSRWAAGTFGIAQIRVIGDRLFALYTDNEGRMAGKTWVLEAVIAKDKSLMGRWVQIGNARDTGPFIGLIVDNERIDGVWSAQMSNRWDFRRRLDGSETPRKSGAAERWECKEIWKDIVTEKPTGAVTNTVYIVDVENVRYRAIINGKEEPWRGKDKGVTIKDGAIQEDSKDQYFSLNLKTGRGEFSPPEDKVADLTCKKST